MTFPENPPSPNNPPHTLPLSGSTVAVSENQNAAAGKQSTTSSKAKSVDIVEHLMDPDELMTRYETSFEIDKPQKSKGLTASAAASLTEKYGPNKMSPAKTVHPIIQWLKCVGNMFNILLIISGILCYILLLIDPTQNNFVGAILIGVAILNGTIEYVQIRKSEKILASFMDLVPRQCKMIRDGNLKESPASELVPGDIVLIRSGDKLPADLRIFWGSDLKVDNSSLTGEAEPQDRFSRNTAQNPLEATNLMFNGTLCVSGEGYGVVIRTGDNTVLGQIAGLTANEKKRMSPLTAEINAYVRIISSVATFTAILFFIIALTVQKQTLGNTLIFAIGVFVAWVPEGLPATVTVLLSIAAQRMAKRNVLVKDLTGVETLGAITLLATDKTGTLTRNQMTATSVWTNLAFFKATVNTHGEDPVFTPAKENEKEILNISTLCTRAKFSNYDVPLEQRAVLGDATEAGLLRFACKFIEDSEKLADDMPKVIELPFSSDTKWHLTVHSKPHSTGNYIVYMKGAPERVLRLCSTFYSNGEMVTRTSEHDEEFKRAYEKMAGKGHRVLAFAYLPLPSSSYPEGYGFSKDPINFPTSGLCFLGLVSMEDPPKHGVREAIGRCRQAGIKVMMVTGDHPLTAEAIARKINLMLGETRKIVAERTNRKVEDVLNHEFNAIVVHGETVESLTDEDWDEILSKDEVIFARTSPAHKLEIVKRCQAIGHIVGVTGDGVNDSPALKKADLGIAMNISGSDVSKEAATMILVDDNFASTVAGIEEGRLIFQNLKKSIQYTITHTLPEVAACLLNVAVPIPLPLSAILIIFIDLGFELFLALSFAWEIPESDLGLLQVKPRKPVTPESIAALRAEELMHRNESPENSRPKRGLMKFFSVDYWACKLRRKDEEILVDESTLSYAYLEIGLIESIGCHIIYFITLYYLGSVTPTDAYRYYSQDSTYFTPEAKDLTTSSGRVLNATEQVNVLASAQSAYFLGMFIQQAFNMYACKSAMRLPSLRIFRNKYSWGGLLIGCLFCCFLVYTPAVQIAFVSNNVPSLVMLVAVAFGIVIFVYNVLRVYISLHRKRSSNQGGNVPLDLHPTVWTIRK